VILLDTYRQPADHSASAIENAKNRVFAEMLEMIRDAAIEGRALDYTSVQQAINFLAYLPYNIQPPSSGLEPDGKLLLEWVRREPSGHLSMFSLVFDDDDFIFSALADGAPSIRGTLNYCSESRLSIEQMIFARFPNSRHGAVVAC
jgi:hypothetical protein